MTDRGKKAVTSGVVKVLRAFGLAGLYAHFAPKVRHSNQNDMPTVTINRIWFLRENRFLIFTRGGPIEVSLKPSLVLSCYPNLHGWRGYHFLFGNNCEL